MKLLKCCTQYVSKFSKLSSGHKNWKRSVFIPISKKSNAKKVQNYHTTAHISHASKVVLNILQARLQQYVNWELPDVQTGFRRSKGTKDQIANTGWILEKQRSSRKTSTSAPLTIPKSLCGSQQISRVLKRWEYQTILPISQETCMWVKKQQLEQQVGSKLGRNTTRSYIVTLLI